MCRNIRPLYNFDPPATEEEIHDAALQFIRKVSGFSKPSKINTEAFNVAVSEIEDIVHTLFSKLETRAKPKNRDTEAAKAKKRFEDRLDRLRQS